MPATADNGFVAADTAPAAAGSTSAAASITRALPPILPTAGSTLPNARRKNIHVGPGPSPAKGSGQDRFRQMITGTAMVPFSVATGVSQAGQTSTNGTAPNLPKIPPKPNDSDHRIAVNPALFSHALSLGRGNSKPEDAPNSGTGYHPAGARGRSSSGSATSWVPYTSTLSAECQKRHFNPQFTEWAVDGGYKASVNVNGFTVVESRYYRSAADAKQGVARRALEYVQSLPLTVAVVRHRDVSQADLALMAIRNYHQAEEDSRHDRRKQEQNLVELVYAHYGGRLGGISDRVLTDSIAAQSFLQGFALGSKTREIAHRRERAHSTERSRSPRFGYDRYDSIQRERSPACSSRRSYRERSPRRGSSTGFSHSRV